MQEYPGIQFALLKNRLVAHLRSRVRSGELTERRVARLSGISQPHVHNVLSGKRVFSSSLADQVMRSLGISLFDLLEPGEGRLGGSVAVPVLDGRNVIWLPEWLVERLEQAAAFVLSADPGMEPFFHAGDIALVEQSEAARLEPGRRGCYIVEARGELLIRRVRKQRQRLYLLSLDNPNPLPWDFISLADRNILEVVRAKVIWTGRNLEHPSLAPEPPEQTR